MNALEELEQKKFIHFDIDLKTYLSDIRRLPRSPNPWDSEREWFVAVDPEGSPKDKQFSTEGYAFTDLGHQAADAIVKAVAAQLGQR